MIMMIINLIFIIILKGEDFIFIAISPFKAVIVLYKFVQNLNLCFIIAMILKIFRITYQIINISFKTKIFWSLFPF